MYLIPRMHDWVNNNYPGTKAAITEYNWGALDRINDALAQADVLGIFGRESLDRATLQNPLTTTQPRAFAFRMYRNYNSVGDISMRATSTDQLAIYAAQRSSDNALTLMLINKTNAITRQPDPSISSTGFMATFPASSITLLVIPTQSSSTPSNIFLPLVRRN